jgi:probable phosphoglycerate mutase
MGTVLLLRHGETDWNREGRTQGWAPVPLNERGREQAAATGEHLAATVGIDRIVASDLERARETAAIVREHVDAPVTHDRAFRERHFGVFQGLPGSELFERFPEYALSEHGMEAARRTPEAGESFLETRERVLGGWEELVATLDGGTALVVAHGGAIKLLLGHLKGLDAVESVLEQSQSNCGVTEVRPESGEVVRENETVY